MFMRIVVSLSLLALAACRFESTADLRPSTESYKPAAAFPIGEHVFQTVDQNRLMIIDVQDGSATVAHQDKGGQPDAEQMITLLDSESFPENVFVAMAMGGKAKDGVQSYRYYPFSFGKTHLEWYRLSETTRIFGLADLSQQMTRPRQTRGTVFKLVPVEQQAVVVQRFKDWRARTEAEEKAAKAAQQTAPAVSAPPAVAVEPTINGMTIGDGVYVQGAFSDQPSVIQQIDTVNRRVKVRRYSDGVSEWVYANRLISRDQSTVNDIARTGAVIGAFVCVFSPDTCKNAKK